MVSPEQPKDSKSGKQPEHTVYSVSGVQENYRRILFWCIQYWRELLDFKFNKYMIVQVLPGVYGILLAALSLSIIGATVMAFMKGSRRSRKAPGSHRRGVLNVCHTLYQALPQPESFRMERPGKSLVPAGRR